MSAHEHIVTLLDDAARHARAVPQFDTDNRLHLNDAYEIQRSSI